MKNTLLILLFILISENIATISKSDKKKKDTTRQGNNLNVFNIYDNNEINVKKDIIDKGLTFNSDFRDTKVFSNGSTLAYVTPWNNYGYDIAKTFATKFSFISPVWLGISYDGNDFQITGSRDIDIKWIMDLKLKNSNLKVIPRLLFENWKLDTFTKVIRSEYIISKCIGSITQFLTKYSFDGVVLEMWLQIGAYSKSDSYHFLTHFGQDMKYHNLIFILAIPPPIYSGNRAGLFNRNDYIELRNNVDFFSLMTYDYSQSPGPNAPLDWMRTCVTMLEPNNDNFARSRILMGLNFYGYQYSSQENRAIIRHELINILKNAGHIEAIWHRDAKEHEFRIKNTDGSMTYVWYPTKESVDLRIKLAESLGVGISIWEIGQGLDYFYNLL